MLSKTTREKEVWFQRVSRVQTDRQTDLYGLVTAPPTTFGYMWLWRSALAVVGDLTLDARLDRVPGSR